MVGRSDSRELTEGMRWLAGEGLLTGASAAVDITIMNIRSDSVYSDTDRRDGGWKRATIRASKRATSRTATTPRQLKRNVCTN